VRNSIGNFNFANPQEELVNNWIGIFDDNDELIKVVSILNNDILFTDDDDPETIALALEEYLDTILFTSEEEEIKDMIKFLRENSEKLLKGKLKKRIEEIEREIEELIKKKKDLINLYNRIENKKLKN